MHLVDRDGTVKPEASPVIGDPGVRVGVESGDVALVTVPDPDSASFIVVRWDLTTGHLERAPLPAGVTDVQLGDGR